MLNENDNLGRDDAWLAGETAAAMRDLARTVTTAPPLLLAAEPAPARVPRRVRFPRHRGWGVPALAAAAVVAVAVTLVLARGTTGAPAGAPSPASTTAGLAGAPAYYVEWMWADPPYLVVGSTRTGQRVATVKAAAGVRFSGVYGVAADDRTFIVTGDKASGPGAGTVWYLLRIAPGSSIPVRLTPLPVPVRQDPAGVALSPDGTKVAVALPGRPATLRVYATATGALLRQWSTAATGTLKVVTPDAANWLYSGMVLRWSADGRQLGFTWNATAIRVLDAAAPDGDLLSRSQQAATISVTDPPGGFACHAAQGWQLITVPTGLEAGQGVVCAGSASLGSSPPREVIGFTHAIWSGHGSGLVDLHTGTDCANPPGQSPTGAYVGWASADGGTLIGSETCDGHYRFGVFRGGTFTPLPLVPVPPQPANNWPTDMRDGAVAW